jgi:hypothetical protein
MTCLERARPVVYVAVILMAFTLRETWMVGLQAAVGGIALGGWLERRLNKWIPV